MFYLLLILTGMLLWFMESFLSDFRNFEHLMALLGKGRVSIARPLPKRENDTEIGGHRFMLRMEFYRSILLSEWPGSTPKTARLMWSAHQIMFCQFKVPADLTLGIGVFSGDLAS